jgi:shikimate kinase
MTNHVSFREQNIIFIGFMGVGKTTIGRKVAERLYRSFIDIDEEISKDFGMPIPEIFEKYGEKTFREKEKEYVEYYTNQRLKVISMGGGAFLQDEIRDMCLKSSIVFFLDMGWESWKDRIDVLIDSRPVLQNRSIEEIEELFHKRQNIYSIHHSRFETDNHSVDEAVDYIIDSLKLAWELNE